MNLQKRLLSPQFVQARYLSDPNSYRYITIIHFLCEQHRMFAPPALTSEIYEWIITNNPADRFTDYSESDLEQDLRALEENNNIISHQDSSRVSKIEYFKNRRLRYQATQSTVELERMLDELNSVHLRMKGSLDPGLIEQLRKYIEQLNVYHVKKITTAEERAEVNRLWIDLFSRFKNLQQETSDYLSIIQSKNMDEALQNKEIGTFRSTFTNYLKNFMMAIQEESIKIESLLRNLERKEMMPWVFGQMAQHYSELPPLGDPVSLTDLREQYENQWQALKKWFVVSAGQRRYVDDLIRETKHTINKFVKHIRLMHERDQQIKSRRHDFLHLAGLFEKETDVELCESYYQTMTNIQAPPHLLVDKCDQVDSRHSIVEYDFKPILLKKRYDYNRRKKASPAIEFSSEDEALAKEIAERLAYEELVIEAFTSNGEITLSELENVEPFLLKFILHCIGRMHANGRRGGYTENGKAFRILINSTESISLQGIDGKLTMPDYVFRFKEVE
ncbi:TIGR02677 family protein [Paenibacillus chitinolyticus]|uniref:TIGR02677 family protein n=1 Tax=Paenibacillus chitinolyticus TaxID=79263 RepID=UPI002DBDD655|nr:TIGR02677 family protein [Paenibacillus chitinolyticus]MEC0248688.1 TIGR02677 family protein [Paenibacillus chitinolyticus]